METLTGFVYSTSFLSQQALGDAVVSFEADLTRRLHSFQPEGTFELQASYAYDLARKPT